MKKIITTLTLIAISLSTVTAQNWQWAKQATLSYRNNEIESVSINNTGDVFVCGYYITSLNIGTSTTLSVNYPGDYQNFIAKYNAAGVPQWLRNIDPQQPNATAGMEVSTDTLGNCYVSSGNGYVSSTPQSIFNYASSYGGFHYLKKINSAGATVWSQNPSFGTNSSCTFESMKTDGFGNTYITGPFTGTVTFGSITLSSPGVSDVFVVKYDPSGFVEYAVQGTGNGSAIGHSIDVDNAGNAVVVGEFQSGITFGTFPLTSNGQRDYFIARLDPVGNFLWAKSDGSTADEELYGVVIDNPRIYVTGNFNSNFTLGSISLTTHGGQDILVACTDINGNELWARANGGGSSDDIGYDIATDHNGGVYASGNYNGPATFGTNNVTGAYGAYVVKYDIIGTQQWVKKIVGTSMSASGKSISANRNNEIAQGSVFCCYGSTLDFSTSSISLNPNGVPGNYGSAFYVAKLGNCNMSATVSPNVSITCSDTTTLTASGGTTFSWSPSTGLNSTNTASVEAHPVVTTTYTCTVGDITGCTASASVTVTVTGGPVISLTGNTSICQGQSTQITASGATSYSWSPTTGINNPNIANPTITPTSTTTYTVTGTDQYGCATPMPVTITVNPLPSQPVITQNGSILSSTLATTYQWYLNGGLIAGATNQDYTPSQIGIYTVTITNIYGCTATSAPFTSSCNLTANAGSNTSITCGNSTTLTATGGTTYSWSPSTGLSGTNTASVQASPVVTTTYTCTVGDAMGCTASASVTVTVSGGPTIFVTGNTTICQGYSTQLTASGAGTYTWSPTTGISDPNIGNPIITPVTTTTYTVTGISSGCTGSTTVTITVNQLPIVTANATYSTICMGDLTTLSGGGASTYSWSNGVTNGVAFSPSSTSTYTVSGTDANSCMNTASTTITVNALPTVTIDLSAVDTLCQNIGTVNLSGESPVGGTYSGTGVTGNTFDATIAGAGTHIITYTYTDGNNCSNTATGNIYVDLCSGINSFNKDISFSIYPNPTNGEFTIVLSDENTEISITDMIGQLIIKTQAVQKATSLQLDQNGVYMVYVKTKQGTTTGKLVVNR